MAAYTGRYNYVIRSSSRPRLNDSYRGFFFLPVFLALTTSVVIFVYVYCTPTLYIDPRPTHFYVDPPLEFSKINLPAPPPPSAGTALTQQISNPSQIVSQEAVKESIVFKSGRSIIGFQETAQASFNSSRADLVSPWQPEIIEAGSVDSENEDVYHDRSLFMEEYKEMNKSLKIYVYPHKKDDPFANVLLPVDYEPGGNYASESYFKKSLFKSHFLTNDPSEADLFYLPFSIASLRHDKRIGVGGIQDFIRNYILNISRSYPFWNRTGGADHFYVACHSVGRSAMDKAVQVKLNAIQVVCSSSYFLPGYVSHKDASIPQIWPRRGSHPTRLPSKRKRLAFYAGAMNSRVRGFLVKTWETDSEISVHRSRLKMPYSEALLGSKFCIHAKGFEVNTARIGDALYYGCVPVVLADHYDLPFADILNWNNFSVIVLTMDIPKLKKILQEIGSNEYLKLQRNVMRVQRHFQWHKMPVDYDAFHMVMYELWLRRSRLRIQYDSLSY